MHTKTQHTKTKLRAVTLSVSLLLLAGCGQEQAQTTEVAGAEAGPDVASAETRDFTLIYQSKVSGEIEPCG